MINLSTKERMLLEDEKSHEQLCVDKYNEYSNKACDTELKNLFSQLAQKEQQHLDSINQLLSGVVPNVNKQQGSQQGNQQNSSIKQPLTNQSQINFGTNSYNEHDKMYVVMHYQQKSLFLLHITLLSSSLEIKILDKY